MSAPKFVTDVHPKKGDTCEGSAMRFSAKVEGSPDPEVAWFCDDEKVEDTKRTKYGYEEDGTVSMTIVSAEPDDQGVWKCVATNEHGSVESTGILGVEFDPTVSHN